MALNVVETLNINVVNRIEPGPTPGPTPVDPTATSPDTGFLSNIGDFLSGLSTGSCALMITIALLLIAGIMIFCLRRKLHHTACTVVGVCAFSLAFGLTLPAIYSVSSATSLDADGVEHTTTFDVNVATGSAIVTHTENIALGVWAPLGYTISAYMDGADNALYNGENKIESIATNSPAPETFDMNTYGVKSPAADSYLPLTTDATHPTLIADVNTAATETTPITLTYATKLDNSTPLGNYTGKIVYVITPKTDTFDNVFAALGKTKDADTGLYKMQDMRHTDAGNTNGTHNLCEVVNFATPPVNDVEATTLVDIRDSQTYTVSKLADGNCWMTQNLDLNLSTDTTFTPADTNILENWTPSAGTVTAVESWEDTYTSPRSYDPGEEYVVTSGTTDADSVYSSLAECTGDGHSEAECTRYYAGNLYNWTAAIASNDSSAYDTQGEVSPTSICPTGWTLPRLLQNEVGKMLYAQGVTTAVSPAEYTADGFNMVRTEPLYWVRAGYIANHARSNKGTSGNYWLDTAYSGIGAFYTNFGNTHIYSGINSNRNVGRAVRCVAH